MCFSLEASLAAGVALGATAIAIQLRGHPLRHQQGIACLPLIFSVHQFTEAGVWATVGSNEWAWMNSLLSYFYVFIAFTFWPMYVPWAVAKFNRNFRDKRLLACAAIGALVGLYLLFVYVFYHPLSTTIGGCHFSGCRSIVYDVRDPLFATGIKYPYLVAATFPFFFCHNKRVRWLLGPLFVISFPIGMLMAYDETFPSIWCFLAAILSVAVYFVFNQPSRTPKAPA